MELIYQYLWRYRLLDNPLALNDGTQVEVISPGILNRDAGPDFFNARLRFGPVEEAGNVEVHVRASDWYRHGHDHDPAYDSVALHVVGVDDRQVTSCHGRKVPQAEVVVPPDVYLTYRDLVEDRKGVRCRNRLAALSTLDVTGWIETLAIERLQDKASRVTEYLGESRGDWNRALFITLARALGSGTNGMPFEILAKNINLNHIGRHSDDPVMTEAFLFGQAGMLEEGLHPDDAYYLRLCREYRFLVRKYSVRPLNGSMWKKSTRPQNFPELRIALLAKALQGGFRLFDRIMSNCRDEGKLREALNWKYDGYWATHYAFGRESALRTRMTQQQTTLLLINVAAPVVYAYGSMRGDERLEAAAIDLLESLPAESNRYIAAWQGVGIKADNAMQSQALIHLSTRYCDPGRCLDCRFAYRMLGSSVASAHRLREEAPYPADDLAPYPSRNTDTI